MDIRSDGFSRLDGAVDGVCPEAASVTVSLVLICGSSGLPCGSDGASAQTSWTAVSLVLILGRSGSFGAAGSVPSETSRTFRTADFRILIFRRSGPAAEAGSVLPPLDGGAPPSLAVTASLVLIFGCSRGGGSWGEGCSAGGSCGVDGSGAVGDSASCVWPRRSFLFFRRDSTPRSAPRSIHRAPPTAVSSIRSPP